jgi:hypothetical protein
MGSKNKHYKLFMYIIHAMELIVNKNTLFNITDSILILLKLFF